MHHRFSILLVFAVLALLGACRKDLNDTEIPVAQFVFPAEDNLTFTDSLRFTTFFTDNENLIQYRLNISYRGTNFDSTGAKVSPYKLTWLGNINGTEFIQPLTFLLPDTALSGNYLAVLNCVDESGKQSATDTVIFNIINTADTVKPFVIVQSPAEGQIVSTDSLNVLAAIGDANNVIYYSVTLTDSIGTQRAQAASNINENSFPIDVMFGVAALPAGNYTVTITTRDAYYNFTLITIPIVIN
jgi:hypothetical protein